MESLVAVPLRLSNDTLIRVEAISLKRGGDSDVAFTPLEKALHIEGIQGAIEGIGKMAVDALRKIAPSKATVEFAIEVGLENGQLIAFWVKGAGKANLKITLEWSSGSMEGPHG